MAVKLNNLKAEGEAEMLGDNFKADIDVSSSDLLYESEGQIAEFKSLTFRYKGDVNNYDKMNANVEMSVNDLSFTMDDVTLVNEADLRFISPLNATLSTMDVDFGNSQLALNNMFIDFVG